MYAHLEEQKEIVAWFYHYYLLLFTSELRETRGYLYNINIMLAANYTGVVFRRIRPIVQPMNRA